MFILPIPQNSLCSISLLLSEVVGLNSCLHGFPLILSQSSLACFVRFHIGAADEFMAVMAMNG